MIIPPQKKKKKDIVFENISQFTRKWIEYFCVLGLVFFGGAQRKRSGGVFSGKASTLARVIMAKKLYL